MSTFFGGLLGKAEKGMKEHNKRVKQAAQMANSQSGKKKAGQDMKKKKKGK